MFETPQNVNFFCFSVTEDRRVTQEFEEKCFYGIWIYSNDKFQYETSGIFHYTIYYRQNMLTNNTRQLTVKTTVANVSTHNTCKRLLSTPSPSPPLCPPPPRPGRWTCLCWSAATRPPGPAGACISVLTCKKIYHL